MARVKWISGLPAPLVCVVSALAVSAYLICLLKAEAQVSIAAAIAGGVAAVALLKIAGVLDPVLECVHRAGRLWAGLMLAMAVFLVLFFHDDHYVLFLLGTVFIYSTAVLGINVQLGYTGLINFAGASFFGVGGYTEKQHFVGSSRNFKLEFLFHTANLIDICHTDQRFV